jgi:predicted transposase/invertase (TIGR01784 family)
MSKKGRILISFDYALKRLLRDKANYDVLEGFLSELLEYDVKVKNIIESETNQTNVEDKHNQVDILIEDKKGELLAVELQFTLETDYFHRMLYGASKILVERMKRGKKYIQLRKVISINIVYFDLGQGKDYVYYGNTTFEGMHFHDELQLSEVQRKRFCLQTPSDIYPEYYVLKIEHFDDVAKDKLDEWIYFFKHNSVKDEFTAKGLDKVRKTLLYDNLTPEEQAEYDELQEIRSRNLSELSSAKDEGELKASQKYETIIAEKETAIARERKEKEAAIAEKEAAIAREREKELALARALAELAALKNNNQL